MIMFNKALLVTGVLILSRFAFAGVKVYDIVLPNATKVGDVQLRAGEYRVSLDGASAVFTDTEHRKSSVTLPVKVESAAKKYGATAVEVNDSGQLISIEVSGSTTKLDFGQ
jgi:hypothetical protein